MLAKVCCLFFHNTCNLNLGSLKSRPGDKVLGVSCEIGMWSQEALGGKGENESGKVMKLTKAMIVSSYHSVIGTQSCSSERP